MSASVISERQRLANQRNAQKSTGPITPEGKAVVRRNAIKHGLCSSQTVLEFESAEEYDQLLAGLRLAHKPVDEQEDAQVRLIAHQYWRIHRHLRVESGAFSFQSRLVKHYNGISESDPGDPDEFLSIVFMSEEKLFDRLSRYEAAIQRAYARALQQLTTLQRTRGLRHTRVPEYKPAVPEPVPQTVEPEQTHVLSAASQVSEIGNGSVSNSSTEICQQPTEIDPRQLHLYQLNEVDRLLAPLPDYLVKENSL